MINFLYFFIIGAGVAAIAICFYEWLAMIIDLVIYVCKKIKQ
jgi:hypothetical protein